MVHAKVNNVPACALSVRAACRCFLYVSLAGAGPSAVAMFRACGGVSARILIPQACVGGRRGFLCAVEVYGFEVGLVCVGFRGCCSGFWGVLVM